MDGIIVGSDLSQEWLLPWWWNHYQKHNSYRVAFIDLGLSFEAKEWCRKHGEWIPLRIFSFAAEKEELQPEIVETFEREFGRNFWPCRDAWFKKPLACLKSPFQRSLWIDLDCEIRGSLAPLFNYADSPERIAMAKEQVDKPPGYPLYNSGVIAFQQNHPLLSEWADHCRELNSNYRGDQEVFSYLLAKKKIGIAELPPLYNWSRCHEESAEALIQHWHGHIGKQVIRSQISLSPLSNF